MCDFLIARSQQSDQGRFTGCALMETERTGESSSASMSPTFKNIKMHSINQEVMMLLFRPVAAQLAEDGIGSKSCEEQPQTNLNEKSGYDSLTVRPTILNYRQL